MIAALALGLLGCGEDVVLGDGRAPLDAAGTDAGHDAAALPALDFSAPIEVSGITAADAADDDPSLTTDLTLLFFNSEREGGMGQEDIWFAERAAPADDFGSPLPAAPLNSELRETGIALAGDGLSIFWSSDRDGGEGGLDVYASARATRDAAWSAPRRVDELSSEGDDLVSALTDAGRSVLLARRDDEDDDYDLFVAARGSAADAWGEPQPLAELNSDEEESDAFAVADGTRLLFTRDEDLQLAERAGSTATFGAAVALDALNSDADDRDAWASDDLSYVVFSSDRSGTHRLYQASR